MAGPSVCLANADQCLVHCVKLCVYYCETLCALYKALYVLLCGLCEAYVYRLTALTGSLCAPKTNRLTSAPPDLYRLPLQGGGEHWRGWVG